MKKLILLLTILCCLFSFTGIAQAWDEGGWDTLKVPFIRKTAAPAVTDDDFGVPYLWVDETNDKFYLLIDNTAGAAIWQEVTAIGGSPSFVAVGIGVDPPTYPLHIIMSATDLTGVYIDGESNDYTGAGVGVAYSVKRDVLQTAITNQAGQSNYLNLKHTAGQTNTINYTYANINRVDNNAVIENDSADNDIYHEYGTYSWIDAKGGTYYTKSSGDLEVVITGVEAYVETTDLGVTEQLDLNDDGGGGVGSLEVTGYHARMFHGPDVIAGTWTMNTTGFDATIRSEPELTGGTIVQNTNGLLIDIDASDVGTSTARGIYIAAVAGADTNYAIYDASGADNYLTGDLEVGSLTTPYANTITVATSGGDYTDLSEAVIAASAGDTVLVYPGTYTDTILFDADNVTVIGIGWKENIIVTQADASVVDFNTRTGTQIRNMTLQVTAATTAIATVTGTTGSCQISNCYTRMVTAADIVAASQPCVAKVTGAGTLKIRHGKVDYFHTGSGAGAIKSAFCINTGGIIHLGWVHHVTITNSGTATASSLCFDMDSTGVMQMHDTDVVISDPDATLVIGLAYLGGTGMTHEFINNNIHVTVVNNTGYALWAADTASETFTAFNHIYVKDTAGSSYGFLVPASATVISHFDDIIAVDGNTIGGTFSSVNSPSDGNLVATGNLSAATMNMTPSATTASPTLYANDTSIVVSSSVVRVAGNGAAVVLDADPAIADGARDGQILYIQGCSDSNSVQIADACNTQLAEAAAVTLGLGDIITLLWDSGGSLWREVARSNN